MTSPDDAALRVPRPIPLHSVPQKPKLDGISDEDLREHIAQTSARLEAGIRAIDRLVEQGAEHSKQLQSNTDAIRSLEITVERNGQVTAQRLDNLATAVTLAAQRGRERDFEIERKALEASGKASGVRQALQSHQDLEAERRKADEIAKRLADEQDRRRDAEMAEIRRKLELAEALRQAEEAKYEDAAAAGRQQAIQKANKDVGKNVGVWGGISSVATAVIAALNGQSPLFIISIGIGGALLAAAFVLVVWFIRKGTSK